MNCYTVSYGLRPEIRIKDLPTEILIRLGLDIETHELAKLSVPDVQLKFCLQECPGQENGLKVPVLLPGALVLAAPHVVDVGCGFKVRYSYGVDKLMCLGAGVVPGGRAFLVFMLPGQEFSEYADGQPNGWTIYFNGERVVKRLAREARPVQPLKATDIVL